ncbi:MAG TPA: alpha/beta hydrolase [Acidimicrobiales bacterium]|nr:alpha/beta hydrolase [Acidimicrobiales bacterium]
MLLGGLVAAGAAAGVTYRQLAQRAAGIGLPDPEGDESGLGWGVGATRPEHRVVVTGDGAELAVWDLEAGDAEAPVVVLPHCWGCSHEIWLPVARRLREQGHRVVLYDQRGHGLSSRGTAPLEVETLAHDLSDVLEATDVRDAVLAGHSMGGMTIMSLATYRPEVLKERAKATVLVATAATAAGGDRTMRGARVAGAFIGSPFVTRSMRTRNGHVLVRGVFGVDPVRSHMDLTRQLFADCHGQVRGGFLVSMATMDLLEGISTIDVPTTVLVGSRDTLTIPAKADEMVSTIPGARLITLKDRGHMLPLEDPDTVTDEIVRAVKG